MDRANTASDTTATADLLARTGVVVIGRNEGERLRVCLRSLAAQSGRVVYVDSGSSDGSLALAASMGVDAIALDPARPFTAARGRNAGFARLMQRHPQIEFVQFIDGDCEVDPKWIEAGAGELAADASLGAVFGRVSERFPEKSIFNQLCAVEWRVATGDTAYFPGNVMLRVQALHSTAGYREDLIAGEDPELSVRVRALGLRIVCRPEPMVLHDANILQLRQWWRRTLRAGHAVAEGAAMHGRGPDRFRVRERTRALGWGLALPAAVIAATLAFGPIGLCLLLLPVLQMLRIFLRQPGTLRERAVYAVLTVAGKPAEALGVLRYWLSRHQRSAPRLIEYK